MVHAVNTVNLSVNKGDFLVILGHSGSGKTTLLSLIGGLTAPDQGQVYIDGVENWQQSDQALSTMRNSKIGFIFQFASLIPTLSVMENILLPLSFGKSRRQPRSCPGYSRPGRPGGQGQCLSLPAFRRPATQGRHCPLLYQLPGYHSRDEPTGDLDEETEKDILGLFRRYNEQGTTFVVVTHNSDLAATQKGARVFSMRQGVLTPQAG